MRNTKRLFQSGKGFDQFYTASDQEYWTQHQELQHVSRHNILEPGAEDFTNENLREQIQAVGFLTCLLQENNLTSSVVCICVLM